MGRDGRQLPHQAIQDGVDLGRVGRDVHRDLADHPVGLLPPADQAPYFDGVPGDRRGLRRGEHRDDHVFGARLCQVALDLLAGQLDRRHRARPGKLQHQPRASADHRGPVLRGQRAADHGGSLLLQKPEAGGEYQYVKDLRDANAGDMNFEGVDKALDGKIKPVALNIDPGTLVLFRGRNSLHRVTPTIGETTRILVVLAYNAQPDIALSPSARMTFFGRLGE